MMLVLMMIFVVWNKNIKLELTPQQHFLVLYTSTFAEEGNQEDDEDEVDTINFKIDFGSSDIVLSSEFKGTSLYLDKNHHKALDNRANIQYKTIKKPPQKNQANEEESHGIIGLNKNSQFFKALKLILEINDVKLWFHVSDNFIEVLPSECNQPIFPPYDISLYSHVTHQNFRINNISLQFHPKVESFISLFGKKKAPLVLYNQELNKKLNLNFRNQAQSVIAREMLGKQCLKYSGSRSFQCEFQNGIEDVGMLLFYFDPILCSNLGAIELLQQAKLDSSGYFWGHFLLIALQFIFMWICQKKNWGNLKLDKWNEKYQ